MNQTRSDTASTFRAVALTAIVSVLLTTAAWFLGDRLTVESRFTLLEASVAEGTRERARLANQLDAINHKLDTLIERMVRQK